MKKVISRSISMLSIVIHSEYTRTIVKRNPRKNLSYKGLWITLSDVLNEVRTFFSRRRSILMHHGSFGPNSHKKSTLPGQKQLPGSGKHYDNPECGPWGLSFAAIAWFPARGPKFRRGGLCTFQKAHPSGTLLFEMCKPNGETCFSNRETSSPYKYKLR